MVRKKFVHIILLLSILFPFLTTAGFCLPQLITAEESADIILIDNDALKVTVTSTISGAEVLWTINYQQRASTAPRVTQFKIMKEQQVIKMNQLGLSDASEFIKANSGQWFQAKKRTTEEISKSLQFSLPLESEFELFVQVSETQRNYTTENILSEAESGPHVLKVSAAPTTTSTSESQSQTGVPTTGTTTTQSSTEEIPVRSTTETPVQQKAPVTTAQTAISSVTKIPSGPVVYDTTIAARLLDNLNQKGRAGTNNLSTDTINPVHEKNVGEFVYFISQPMIDVSGGQASLPKTISITDNLPAGVELVDGANSISLYNLDEVARADKDGASGGTPSGGFTKDNLVYTPIEEAFSADSVLTGQQLKINLSGAAVAKINTLSEQPAYAGKDFVIQLNVRAIDTAFSPPENLSTTVENSATSIFGYEEAQTFSANSNTTQVELTHTPKNILKFISYQTGTTTPVVGATFELYSSEQAMNSGDAPLTEKQTSDQDGNFQFSVAPSNYYYLHEVSAPTGYTLSEDIEVNAQAGATNQKKTADGRFIVYDDIELIPSAPNTGGMENLTSLMPAIWLIGISGIFFGFVGWKKFGRRK